MMDKERINNLIAAKFEKTGTWRRNEQQQAICDGSVPTSPGVYLFIVGGVVRYVGSAQRSLFARMKSYERRQRDRTSTRPVHAELGRAIDGSLPVEVHTLVIDQPARTCSDALGGLPIDYAVGLEAGLIEAIDPDWNRRGRRSVLDEIDH
jgi:hypothetical protein